MRDFTVVFFYAVLAVTFLAGAAYLVHFISQNKKVRKLAWILMLLSGVLQSGYIVLGFIIAGHTPLSSQHDAVVFFAWSTTIAYFSFRWWYSVKNFGTLVSLLIASLLLIASFSEKTFAPLPPALQSVWLPIHGGVSLFAYGFLSLAFCGSIMYLLLERELKSKRFGYFFARFPSLDALDQLNHHCLIAGFIFLTVGIVTGSLWARQAWGTYWQWDPKETWSLITWCIYLVQLHQRLTVGWRGKRAAAMSVLGFAAVLFTLWGVAYLLGGVHSYAR